MTAAFFPSPRLSGLALSANAAASQRAQELRMAGRDIINLTIGEPDFDTPQSIKDAALRAMSRGQTKYPNTQGTPDLRAAIAAKLAQDRGISYSPGAVLVANGGKQVIHNAFAATLSPRDEVVIPTPCWASFPDIAAFTGGVPVPVPCLSRNGFALDPAALAAALTPRTRWVVLNSPNNPTGAILDPDRLAAIADVLRAHPHTLILCDEIYEHIYFTPAPPPSLIQIAPDLAGRILLVNGVSKTYAMTGWRIGWGAGPQDLIGAMTVVQSLTTSGACSIAQAAALAALTGDQAFVQESRRAYATRAQALTHGLTAVPGLKLVPPQGGFFALPDCSSLLGRRTPAGPVIADDQGVADYLLEQAGVACVAGSSLGLPGHLRLSLAAATPDITDACQRVAQAVALLDSAA